jgi:hypothetical protein
MVSLLDARCDVTRKSILLRSNAAVIMYLRYHYSIMIVYI